MKGEYWYDIFATKSDEQVIFSWLQTNYPDAQDVSGNPEYWPQDVDFLADGRKWELKVEPTSDWTGNVFIEFFNDNNRNCDGWYRHTQADILLFYAPHHRELKIVPMPALRAYIEANKHRIKQRECNSGYGRNGLPTLSRGYILPISELKQIEACEVYNLGEVQAA